MAEALLLYAALPALRLAGSLVVAGWEVLTGGMTTECSLTHWSGDLVLQMSRKQRRQQSLQQRQWEHSPAAGLSMTPRGPRPDDRTAMAEASPGAPTPMLPSSDLDRQLALRNQENLLVVGDQTLRSVETVRNDVSALRNDVSTLSEVMEATQDENKAFLERFTAMVEEAIRGQQESSLKQAKFNLNSFYGSDGDISFLRKAHKHAEAALAQESLDMKLSAGLIAVSTGYVVWAKEKSPERGKKLVVEGTLKNIATELMKYWKDPAQADEHEGRKVLAYMLDMVSCIAVFPPSSSDVVTMLLGMQPDRHRELAEALGLFCAKNSHETAQYPDTAPALIKHVLRTRSLGDLVRMASAACLDTSACHAREDIQEALGTCGKALRMEAPTSRDVGVQTGESDADVALVAVDEGGSGSPPCGPGGAPGPLRCEGVQQRRFKIVKKDNFRVYETESGRAFVGFLPRDTVVDVSEVRGSNIRIVHPMEGWGSLRDESFGLVFATEIPPEET